MNINTGEIVDLSDTLSQELRKLRPTDHVPEGTFSEQTQKKDVALLSVGMQVSIAVDGYDPVRCVVEYINVGKQRISVRPLGKVRVQSTDPIVSVRSAK